MANRRKVIPSEANRLVHEEGYTQKEAAVKLGCSTSTVIRALRKYTPPIKKKPKQVKCTSDVTMEVSKGFPLCIRIRDKGRLFGTLSVSNDGVAFKSPNAKLKPANVKWELFDKLNLLNSL